MFALVLFAYHETSLARDNLHHFVTRGLLPPTQGEHVFVLNGPHSREAGAFAAGNVAVVERANDCFDFGAWGVGLDEAVGAFGPRERYTHFFFLNASVRGPYLPLFEARPWWVVFVDQLGGPGNVGLVGTSLNCWASLGETHLQSMFWATHAEGLDRVVLPSGVLGCKADHDAAVFGGEIPLSRAFLLAVDGTGEAARRGWRAGEAARRGWRAPSDGAPTGDSGQAGPAQARRRSAEHHAGRPHSVSVARKRLVCFGSHGLSEHSRSALSQQNLYNPPPASGLLRH